MEILILLLVSPAILAQRYRKHVNPNDEPFLPIHPVYPYNPKLTKRGFDKEIVTVLKPELYAPRTDARDSYTASFAGNPKDSYFPGYGSPPHSSVAPYSPYSSYYGNGLYGAYMNPYSGNPYGPNPYTSPANPYTSGVHGSSPYSGYYHQPPYYYPDYYNQPFPYSFPPPDHSGPPGPPWNESPHSSREYSSGKYEKPKSSMSKVKENLTSSSNGSGNQYVDGSNMISSNHKDLSAQSSAYKTSNPYNHIEQVSNLHFKGLPTPQTTYKVISVGGQLVGPNYPLPSTYARAQLMEQIAVVKNLAKSLGHVFSHQTSGTQGLQGISSYVPYPAALGQQNSLGKPDQHKYYVMEQNPSGNVNEGQYYSGIFNSPGKTAEAHIYGSDDRDLPDQESKNQFLTANQDTPGKFVDPLVYGDRQISQNTAQSEFVTGQSDKSQETFAQSPASLFKIPSKYQALPYVQKPGTRVTFQKSQSTYIPPVKIRPTIEEADPSSVQSYDLPAYRIEQSFRPDQMQGAISYQSQHVSHGTPQAYTYHQTNVLPLTQTPQQQQQQQQQQQTKTNLEDVNFGAKQGNKG